MSNFERGPERPGRYFVGSPVPRDFIAPAAAQPKISGHGRTLRLESEALRVVVPPDPAKPAWSVRFFPTAREHHEFAAAAAEFRAEVTYVSRYSNLKEKWAQLRGMRSAVSNYFRELGIPLPKELAKVLDSKAHLALWRPIATLRGEDFELMELAKRHGITPIWITYPGASRVYADNGLRSGYFVLQRVGGTGGSSTVEPDVIGSLEDFRNKLFSEAKTYANTPLVQYHKQFRWLHSFEYGREHIRNVVDVSDWALAARKKGFTKFALEMILGIGHCFVAANFSGAGEAGVAYDDRRIVSLVEPTLREIHERFKHQPQLLKLDHGPNASCYPSKDTSD